MQNSEGYGHDKILLKGATKPNIPEATLLLEAWRSFYLMQFADCGNGYSLSRCRVINDILARPELGERLDTRFCSIEGLRCLYETQLSVVEHIADHIEDAEGLAHPKLQIGDDLLGGTVEPLSHQSGELGIGARITNGGESCRAKLICPRFAPPLALPAVTLLYRPK